MESAEAFLCQAARVIFFLLSPQRKRKDTPVVHGSACCFDKDSIATHVQARREVAVKLVDYDTILLVPLSDQIDKKAQWELARYSS